MQQVIISEIQVPIVKISTAFAFMMAIVHQLFIISEIQVPIKNSWNAISHD